MFLRLFIVGLAIFFSVFQASAASEKSVHQMDCELKNFFGFRVGSVTQTSEKKLLITYGFLGNQLSLGEVAETEIRAVDVDGNFSYSFSFEEPLGKRNGTYVGTLFQQSIRGFKGAQIAVARFECLMGFK